MDACGFDDLCLRFFPAICGNGVSCVHVVDVKNALLSPAYRWVHTGLRYAEIVFVYPGDYKVQRIDIRNP